MELNSTETSNLPTLSPQPLQSNPRETIKNLSFKSKNMGKWTISEHKKLLEGIKLYGNDWTKVQSLIGTRNSTQARSHAQKFFLRLKRQINLNPILKEYFQNKYNEKEGTTDKNFSIKYVFDLLSEGNASEEIKKECEKIIDNFNDFSLINENEFYSIYTFNNNIGIEDNNINENIYKDNNKNCKKPIFRIYKDRIKMNKLKLDKIKKIEKLEKKRFRVLLPNGNYLQNSLKNNNNKSNGKITKKKHILFRMNVVENKGRSNKNQSNKKLFKNKENLVNYSKEIIEDDKLQETKDNIVNSRKENIANEYKFSTLYNNSETNSHKEKTNSFKFSYKNNSIIHNITHSSLMDNNHKTNLCKSANLTCSNTTDWTQSNTSRVIDNTEKLNNINNNINLNNNVNNNYLNQSNSNYENTYSFLSNFDNDHQENSEQKYSNYLSNIYGKEMDFENKDNEKNIKKEKKRNGFLAIGLMKESFNPFDINMNTNTDPEQNNSNNTNSNNTMTGEREFTLEYQNYSNFNHNFEGEMSISHLNIFNYYTMNNNE